MATRDRRPVQGPQPHPAGERVGTVTAMAAQLSAAGNAMDVVTFDVEGKEVRAFLLHKGAQAVRRHEMVKALGLPQQFRYSQAIGRQCRLTLGVDGTFNTIEKARPL